MVSNPVISEEKTYHGQISVSEITNFAFESDAMMLNLIPGTVNIWLAASCTDVIQKNVNAQENNLTNGA